MEALMASGAEWACDDCGFGRRFAKKVLLSRHIRRLHQHFSPRKSLCDTCSQEFADKRSLTSHVQAHLPEKPAYECDTCGRKISDERCFRRHCLRHIGSGRSLHSCDTCSYSASLKSTLFYHWLAQHAACNAKARAVLKRRVEVVALVCDDCGLGRSFAGKWPLGTHIRSLHQHSPLRSLCDVCRQVFSDRRHLTNHMERHFPLLAIEAYVCDICSKEVALKASLGLHCFSHIGHPHSGKSALFCDDCSVSTCYRTSMANHAIDQHGHGHRRKHKALMRCDDCPQEFKEDRRHSFFKHWLTARHTEDSRPSFNRCYGAVCDCCGRHFLSKYYLVQHNIQTHALRYKRLQTRSMRCDNCSQRHFRSNAFRHWLYWHHNNVAALRGRHIPDNRPICDDCCQRFKKFDITQHWISQHGPPGAQFWDVQSVGKCDVCQSQFTKSGLFHHWLGKHQSGNAEAKALLRQRQQRAARNYPSKICCDDCGLSRWKGAFHAHYLAHRNRRNRKTRLRWQ